MNIQLAASFHNVPGWLLLLHVLGVLLWAGGLVLVTRLLASVVTLAPDARQAAACALRSGYLKVVFPGFLVAFLTGLYFFLGNPGEQPYMKEGWFHMKLTLLLILMVVDHVMVMRPLKALAKGTMSGDPAKRITTFQFAHVAVALLAVGILTAVFVIR
jgi:uncharacterized membrane protein